MIIRKMFKFENTHIVRNCSSDRCKFSIHGHSYKVELFFTAIALDRGQMIYDFGLMKGTIKDIIDSFDHAFTYWSKESKPYKRFVHEHSARWIELPVSPSAEQLSRVIFILVDEILLKTEFNNNEKNVKLQSVRVHETDTGYAESWEEDAYNMKGGFGGIDLEDIIFSRQIQSEWKDPGLFDKIKDNKSNVFKNPIVKNQIL